MSLVLRLGIPTRVAARITQTAAVAVAKALREMGVEAKIKWPNDLLVRGRKICGILAESSIENVPVAAKRVGSGEGRQVDFVVLGVGLNADLDPQDLGVVENEATTLRSELGRDVDLLALLGSVLSHLDFELGRIDDFESILEDWRALDCTLGERVRVRRFGEVLEGEALDLGLEGALLLKTSDGVVELFEGEIERLRRERSA
jgi:BirA family biotin operon repressor/biotin-[acetyl-CoA-carboxylase] ligase